MRSINASACFISPMDCILMYSESFSYPQFSHISACRKYWLMAVSSSCSALLSSARTFAEPFVGGPPFGVRVYRRKNIFHKTTSSTEAGNQPKNETDAGAEHETTDNRKVDGCVFAFVDDVSGQTPQAKWQSATEKEERSDHDEQSTRDQHETAEFAKSVHQAQCKAEATKVADSLLSGSEASNQIHLFLSGLRANREGIKKVKPERVADRFVLLMSEIALPQNLHAHHCFSRSTHLTNHTRDSFRIGIHVGTDGIDTHEVNFDPR